MPLALLEPLALTLIEGTNAWCTDTCDTSGCSNTCGEIKNHRGPHKCYLH